MANPKIWPLFFRPAKPVSYPYLRCLLWNGPSTGFGSMHSVRVLWWRVLRRESIRLRICSMPAIEAYPWTGMANRKKSVKQPFSWLPRIQAMSPARTCPLMGARRPACFIWFTSLLIDDWYKINIRLVLCGSACPTCPMKSLLPLFHRGEISFELISSGRWMQYFGRFRIGQKFQSRH